MCVCVFVHRHTCGGGGTERVSGGRNIGTKAQSSRVAGMQELKGLEDEMEVWKLCRGLTDVSELWFLC